MPWLWRPSPYRFQRPSSKLSNFSRKPNILPPTLKPIALGIAVAVDSSSIEPEREGQRTKKHERVLVIISAHCNGTYIKRSKFWTKKKWQDFFRLMDQISPQNLPRRQIHPSLTLSDCDEQAWPLFHYHKHVWMEKVEKS